MALQKQRLNVPIGGGLDGAETPEYLDPPALFVCDNLSHVSKTALTKRDGYDRDTVRIDGRIYNDPNVRPLLATPIDRFIQSEGDGLLFAARGYLWNYAPELYATDNTIDPMPSAVRQGEIPDLQIKQTTVVATEVNPVAIEIITEAASATTATNLTCISYVRTLEYGSSVDAIEWRLLVKDGVSGSTLSDTVHGSTTTHLFMHPTVVAFDGGFFACCFDFTTHTIMAARFDLSTMTWATVTVASPTIAGFAHEIDMYDMALLDLSGKVVFALVEITGSISVGVDVISVPGGLYAWTFNVITTAVTNGVHVGKTQWDGSTDGVSSQWPAFAICGNTETLSYGVAWSNEFDGAAGKTYFIAYNATTPYALRTIDETSQVVGCTAITPAILPSGEKWLWCWQRKQTDTSFSVRNTVYFETLTYNDVFIVGADGKYHSSELLAQPWCLNGHAYMLLRPAAFNGSADSFYADTPWILVRPWDDLNMNDTLARYIQKPLAAFGYGTTYGTRASNGDIVAESGRWFQKTRIYPDLSTSGATASGALVTADVSNVNCGLNIKHTIFDPTGPDRYDSAPLPGGGSIFGCANPWIWDGAHAFEAVFVHRPFIVSSAAASGSPVGSLVTDGSGEFHFLMVVYEQSDANGRITRSPATPVLKIAVPSPNTRIDLVVSNLFFNARRPDTIKVQVYMGRDGANFALAASAINKSYSVNDPNPGADVTVHVLAEPTAVSPAIYFSDGSLQSGYGQFASHLIRWNNRIWIGDEHKLSYSHAFLEGEQVQFPDVFQEVIDRRITALTPLDDRMLMFSEDAVMYRSGEGPSPSGQSSSYSSWNFLTHEIGTLNPRSVFHTIVGVFFESRRGLEMMDSGGNFKHVREVENWFSPPNGDAIMGVLSLPRDHQARILYLESLTGTLKQLVLDYTTGTWSRWQQTHADIQWNGPTGGAYYGDIDLAGNIVYLADSQGSIFQEFRGRKYDRLLQESGNPIAYHIDWNLYSPWIKFEGLQGFQRVWSTTVAAKLATFDPVYSIERSVAHGTSVAIPGFSGQPIGTIWIAIAVGGTVGTPGIFYNISYDLGVTYSAGIALGSASTINAPIGASILAISLSAGTLIATEIIKANYQAPQFGISVGFWYDYELGTPEPHTTQTVDAAQAITTSPGRFLYLKAGHATQQCRSMMIRLASADTQAWADDHDVTGVYEIDGFECELGVQRGTGRLAEGNRI
jgi:hypothetical protein